MSQDIKESAKQAHHHAQSKPARSSTVRAADPNAKSRVLDPGVTAETLPEVPVGPTVTVSVALPEAMYRAIHAHATAEGCTVEQLFENHAMALVEQLFENHAYDKGTREPR
jgi:hypothetical protein